jgi:hypothetical protein
MDNLDQKLQFGFKTNQQILNLISEIDIFRCRWEHLENQNKNILTELKNKATIQSIGSSTRIEGAALSDTEIEKLISNIETCKLKSQDEQEVAGYFDVIQQIHI